MRFLWILFLAAALQPLALPAAASGADPAAPKQGAATDGNAGLMLVQAVMCESVEHLRPVNAAVTFSVSIGQVYCLSYFRQVAQSSIVYHRWFRRNELSTQSKLKVYPPHWATYSVIQLREEDKGPWHIEITDENGKVFETLRFSITD
jgi:hypothetical protein